MKDVKKLTKIRVAIFYIKLIPTTFITFKKSKQNHIIKKDETQHFISHSIASSQNIIFPVP
jgi:hypothetical protein